MTIRLSRIMTPQERAKLYELAHRHNLFLDSHSSIPTRLFFQQERNMQSFAERMGRGALPGAQVVKFHDHGDITVGQRLTDEQVEQLDEAFVSDVLREVQIMNGETALSFPQTSLRIPRHGLSQMRQAVAEVEAQPRITQAVIPGTLEVVVRVEVPPQTTHTVELVEDEEEAPAAAPAVSQENTFWSTIGGILYTPIGWIVGLFALLRKCLGL